MLHRSWAEREAPAQPTSPAEGCERPKNGNQGEGARPFSSPFLSQLLQENHARRGGWIAVVSEWAFRLRVAVHLALVWLGPSTLSRSPRTHGCPHTGTRPLHGQHLLLLPGGRDALPPPGIGEPAYITTRPRPRPPPPPPHNPITGSLTLLPQKQWK